MKYAVVHVEYANSKRGAKILAGERGTILPYAHKKCPKGADHAHASYDGATFCSSCGQYLTVRIEKRS